MQDGRTRVEWCILLGMIALILLVAALTPALRRPLPMPPPDPGFHGLGGHAGGK